VFGFGEIPVGKSVARSRLTLTALIRTRQFPFTSFWRPVGLRFHSSYFMFASIEFLLLNKPRSRP
jgi:hypothetical protein